MTLNGGTATPAPTRKFTSAPLHPFWFDVGTPTPSWRLTAGSSTGQSTVNDAVIESYTSATEVRDWLIPIVQSVRSSSEVVSITSSNEAVATANASKASYVSDGTATITVSASVRTVPFSLNFASRGGQTTTSFVSWVNGSACKHSNEEVDTRLTGKSAASALAIFTTQNHATSTYVRNTGCWAYDVDLTCMSPWNSQAGSNMAGVLISPRHVLFAAHYQPEVGVTMRFVKTDNTVVTRTLTAKRSFAYTADYFPDFCVGVLDSDVPAGISFAKVLPANYASYFKSAQYRVAALMTDQEKKALVKDWLGLYTASSGSTIANFTTPIDSKRLEFSEFLVGGDSGSPSFLIVNNALVLLTVATYSGVGAGTDIPPQKTAINAAMTALGGGYQLTEVDLSSFPAY